MKKKSLLLLIAVFILTQANVSFAYNNICQKFDPETGSWNRVYNLCTASPESWARSAMEDIFSFGSDSKEHFENIKARYFTDNGWQEFESVIQKTGIVKSLEMTKQALVAVNPDETKIFTAESQHDETFSRVRLYMPLVWITKLEKPIIGRSSLSTNVLFEVEFLGKVSEQFRLLSDAQIGSKRDPGLTQYDYKIDKIAVVSSEEFYSQTTPKKKPFWKSE